MAPFVTDKSESSSVPRLGRPALALSQQSSAARHDTLGGDSAIRSEGKMPSSRPPFEAIPPARGRPALALNQGIAVERQVAVESGFAASCLSYWIGAQKRPQASRIPSSTVIKNVSPFD